MSDLGRNHPKSAFVYRKLCFFNPLERSNKRKRKTEVLKIVFSTWANQYVFQPLRPHFLMQHHECFKFPCKKNLVYINVQGLRKKLYKLLTYMYMYVKGVSHHRSGIIPYTARGVSSRWLIRFMFSSELFVHKNKQTKKILELNNFIPIWQWLTNVSYTGVDLRCICQVCQIMPLMNINK